MTSHYQYPEFMYITISEFYQMEAVVTWVRCQLGWGVSLYVSVNRSLNIFSFFCATI